MNKKLRQVVLVGSILLSFSLLISLWMSRNKRVSHIAGHTEIDRTFQSSQPSVVVMGPEHVHSIRVRSDFEILWNISRIKGRRVFRSISSTDYPEGFYDAVVLSNHTMNTFNYSFILPGQSICQGEPPDLLFLILSTVNDFEIRSTIRSSWLKASENNMWPRYSITNNIRHAFLLAKGKPYSKKDIRERVQKESEDSKDIILADFIDTYRNLSIKVLTGFTWVLDYCEKAKFVVKVDQDTVLNVPQLISVINTVTKELGTTNIVLGRQKGFAPVSRSGRWAVPVEAYPLDKYPQYLYGHTYALGVSAIPKLLSTAQRLPLLSPEDAFVTGIVAVMSNVTRVTCRGFPVVNKNTSDCDMVWGRQVAITQVKRVAEIEHVWTALLEDKCVPDIDFRSRVPHN